MPDEIDFTTDGSSSGEVQPPELGPPETSLDFGGATDYPEPVRQAFSTRLDLEPGREGVRRQLALGLVVLFALIVLIAMVGVVAGAPVDRLRAILEVILAPVVALCGSAVGFYYADRGNR